MEGVEGGAIYRSRSGRRAVEGRGTSGAVVDGRRIGLPQRWVLPMCCAEWGGGRVEGASTGGPGERVLMDNRQKTVATTHSLRANRGETVSHCETVIMRDSLGKRHSFLTALTCRHWAPQ